MRLSLRATLLLLVGLAGVLPAAALAAMGLAGAWWAGLGIALLLAGGAIIVAWMVGDDLRAATRRLGSSTRRLASGDWRAPVEMAGPPEIAAVAEQVERLRASLGVPPAAAPPRRPPAVPPGESTPADAPVHPQELAVIQALAAAAPPGDLEGALERLLRELVGSLRADGAALYVEGAPGGAHQVAAAAGPGAEVLRRIAPDEAGGGLAGWAASRSELLVVEDLEAGPPPASPELGGLVPLLRAEGYRTVAAVPLRWGDRALGILAVIARVPDIVGARHRQFLQCLGQQVALVLAHAHLQRQDELRAERVQALARFTQALAAAPSPSEVQYLTVLAAAQAVAAAYVRIWLLDLSTGAWQPGPWHGQGAAGEDAAPARQGASGLAPEEALAALAVSQDEAVFIPRVAADPRCPDPAWWEARGAAAVAAIPLRAADRTLGALVVVPAGPSAFLPPGPELLDLVASQGALALGYARAVQGEGAAGEAHFAAALGRTVAALAVAPGLEGAAAALEAGAREALGLEIVRALLLDQGGALRAHGVAAVAPAASIPAGASRSLAARALREGAAQVWDGSGECWEAEVGLVARGAAAVPIVVEGSGASSGHGMARVGCLLLGLPPGAERAGAQLLARAERLAQEVGPVLARVRHLEMMRALHEGLGAVVRLDRAVAEVRGTGPALGAIAEGARRILGAAGAAVLRVAGRDDSAGQSLREAAGSPGGLAPGAVSIRSGIVAAALEAGAPRAATLHPGGEPDRPSPVGLGDAQGATLEGLLEAAGFHRVAVAPVLHGSVAAGVLAVWRGEDKPFDAVELELLGTLAGRTGIVWEEREHRAELEVQAGRLGMVHELVQAVGATRDLDRLADLLIPRLRQMLACDAVTLAFDETERGTVRFARDLHLEEGAGPAFSVAAAETSVPMAMALQEPVITPDLAESGLALHRRWAAAGFRSLAEVPLVAEGQSCGALVAASRSAGGFPPDRMELQTMLAGTVAPLLRNAQRLADLERASRDFTVAQQHLAQTEDLRAVGQVATAVGQGIGERLVAMLGKAREAMQQAQDPALVEILRHIQRDAQEAVETLRRLTRLTRPRRAEAAPAPVDLGEVARQACEMTRARWRDEARARGSVITLVPDLPPVPRVRGDPVALREVIITAILNATNALPRGGTITVRARPRARDGVPGVLVEVADTGVGMPEALRAKVLEPAVDGSGAGLGLASARAEVERHGGHLTVESAPGRGTTVGFWVPTGEIAPVAWAEPS